MNENEIRRANLNLIASKFKLGKELAAILELEPSYLSRMLSGNVNIGRGRGAHIESALGLPYKWMDRKNETVPVLHPWTEELTAREPEPDLNYGDRLLLEAFKTLPGHIQDATRQTILYMSSQAKGSR